MRSEIIQLRDELAKTNNDETGFLRGCVADLIKDKVDRNLLNICLNAGVLQDFIQESMHDTFFIKRCKAKLVEEFFITNEAAEKAIDFCKVLACQLTEIKLIPYRKNEKWGFSTYGKFVLIDCIYNEVREFENGLAAVQLDVKWGYINVMGETIIPFDYDEALSFIDDVAEVIFEGKAYYINKFKELNAIDFKPGYEWRLPIYRECRHFDQKSDLYVSSSFSTGFLSEGNKITILANNIFDTPIDAKILRNKFNNTHPEVNGMKAFIENEKFGFISCCEGFTIPPIYDDIFDFKDDLAYVSYNRKWGYINKTGIQYWED